MASFKIIASYLLLIDQYIITIAQFKFKQVLVCICKKSHHNSSSTLHFLYKIIEKQRSLYFKKAATFLGGNAALWQIQLNITESRIRIAKCLLPVLFQIKLSFSSHGLKNGKTGQKLSKLTCHI